MSHLTRAIGAIKLVSKAHAPTIMVVSGVVSMGASVIMASKKTLDIEDTLAPHVGNMEGIEELVDSKGINPKDADKLKRKIVVHAVTDLTKLYAIPGVLFVGGSCLVFGGHRIMLQRNASLALAFTGLKKSFDFYRSNVRETFGEAADQGMLNGYTTKEVLDEKTGKVETVYVRDWDTIEHDPYNRVFAQDTSSKWIDDLGVNKLFIANQQRMANITLGLQGFLYLNDVYEALGMPKTDVGQVCGWKERRLPDGSRDIPFIDFGLDKRLPDDWKYNADNEIYLDINCQGLIVGGTIQKALEKA